jgi:hypothetical protein
VELFSWRGERPDVRAVAIDIVGEEREGVHAFFRQIVECADEALALAAFPCGIAGGPIADVGLPGFHGDLRLEGGGVVEVGVGEKGFRSVWAGFEEVLAGTHEAEVVFSDVGEAAVGAEVAIGLVGRGGELGAADFLAA